MIFLIFVSNAIWQAIFPPYDDRDWQEYNSDISEPTPPSFSQMEFQCEDEFIAPPNMTDLEEEEKEKEGGEEEKERKEEVFGEEKDGLHSTELINKSDKDEDDDGREWIRRRYLPS